MNEQSSLAPSSPARKQSKKRWTEEEMKIFQKYFEDCIKRKVMPSGPKIKSASKYLINRNTAQIKTRVHNIIEGIKPCKICLDYCSSPSQSFSPNAGNKKIVYLYPKQINKHTMLKRGGIAKLHSPQIVDPTHCHVYCYDNSLFAPSTIVA